MKLWMFRTNNSYYLANFRPTKADIKAQEEASISFPWALHIGWQRPKGFPSVKKGACVPVTLKVEE